MLSKHLPAVEPISPPSNIRMKLVNERLAQNVAIADNLTVKIHIATIDEYIELDYNLRARYTIGRA